jgi:hypothetical protein
MATIIIFTLDIDIGFVAFIREHLVIQDTGFAMLPVGINHFVEVLTAPEPLFRTVVPFHDTAIPNATNTTKTLCML